MRAEREHDSTPPRKDFTPAVSVRPFRSKRGVTCYVVLVLVCVLCYGNSLQGEFVHDDVWAIINNPDVRPGSSLGNIFFNDFWGKRMADNTSHKSYRPLCILTFNAGHAHQAQPPTQPKGRTLAELVDDGRNGNLGGEGLAVLERLQALAKRTGVTVAAVETVAMETLGQGVRSAEEEEELWNAKLNVQLREVFAGRFTAMFADYEAFVIQSAPDMEAWLTNREQMHNFDKASFLSDQPEPYLPFLSHFIETQMFATFIDNKIMSQWEEKEPLLQRFSAGVWEKARLYNVRAPQPPPPTTSCSTLKESAQAIEQRLLKMDHTAIHPHLLDMKIGQGKYQQGFFPTLQADVLATGPTNHNRWSSRTASTQRRKERNKQQSEHLGLDNGLKEHVLKHRT
ncbi:hypothetical protein GJAV_G00272550 [Gymnothorax javanicus]|nr:hypothetical protein GJAV_G00272550 [Gymnothorax javanicus]